jgi:hypothetical protein
VDVLNIADGVTVTVAVYVIEGVDVGGGLNVADGVTVLVTVDVGDAVGVFVGVNK